MSYASDVRRDGALALKRHAAQGDTLRKDAADLSAALNSHWATVSSALECEAEGATVLLLAQQRRQAEALTANLRAASAGPSATARRRDAALRLQEAKLRARGDTRDARVVALKRRREAVAERELRRSTARSRESNLLALQASRHEAQREQLRACYSKHRAKLQGSRNEEVRRVATRSNVCSTKVAHAHYLVHAKVEADAGRALSDAGRMAPFRARGGMAAARAQVASNTADAQAATFRRTIEGAWPCDRQSPETRAQLLQCGPRSRGEGGSNSRAGPPPQKQRQRQRRRRKPRLGAGAAAWRRLGSRGAPGHRVCTNSGAAETARCWWTGITLRPGRCPKSIPGSDAVCLNVVVEPGEMGMHTQRGGESRRRISSQRSHRRPQTAPAARRPSVRAAREKVALQPPPGRDIGLFVSWQAAREWNAQCSPLSQRWLRSLRIDAAEAAEASQNEQPSRGDKHKAKKQDEEEEDDR